MDILSDRQLHKKFVKLGLKKMALTEKLYSLILENGLVNETSSSKDFKFVLEDEIEKLEDFEMDEIIKFESG